MRILEKIFYRLEAIEIKLEKQQVILEEHQRRSMANEEAVKILQAQTADLRKFMSKVEGAGKMLFAILTIIEIASKFWK